MLSTITVASVGTGGEERQVRFIAGSHRRRAGSLVLFRAKRRYWQGRKSAASDLWSFTIFLDFRPLFSDFRKA